MKISGPDYDGIEVDKAAEDFMKRISHYQGTYEPLSEEHDKNLSFIKIFDQGDKFLVNKVLGRYFYGRNSEILNVIYIVF